MFLEDLGLKESGLEKLIKASYKLLGLISYLTAGEPEVRAWTITEGTKAPQAAGKIHSDFERGFIRAEVVSYDDLIACGSHTAAKEKGLIRLEGKDYVVKDGDIMLFRFNGQPLHHILILIPHLVVIQVLGSDRAVLRSDLLAADLIYTAVDRVQKALCKVGAGAKELHLLADEAQVVKNYSSKTNKSLSALNVEHTFALSGTPLENRIEEIWAIFQVVMPGFLPKREKFNKCSIRCSYY